MADLGGDSTYDVTMHFPDVQSFAAALGRTPKGGPLALIVADDAVEIDSTITHHLSIGFSRVALFVPQELQLTDDWPEQVDVIPYDARQPAAATRIANACIAAAPDRWFYLGHNAEYLFFPFCSTRVVPELLNFATEERRPVVMCTTLDLYSSDLVQHPNAVDRDTAHFDSMGYYSEEVTDTDGQKQEAQLAIYGGIRWRMEELFPENRRRLDRPALFRACKDLQMDNDKRFNIAEYNTISCPWHHSITACVASFRAAKALMRNPTSRKAISSFTCFQSQRFDWSDQQLLDLGFMEPGQWF